MIYVVIVEEYDGVINRIATQDFDKAIKCEYENRNVRPYLEFWKDEKCILTYGQFRDQLINHEDEDGYPDFDFNHLVSDIKKVMKENSIVID